RCIGLGACRKGDGGAMCPSYMVTLEEEHSTRGRAHMLFEMLQGEVIRGGWEDENVKEALELCLSCKACKSECPANVDIATYKAEFLSHCYEKKRRPLNAYAFGLVEQWARIGSIIPGIANFFSQALGSRYLLQKLLRLAPQRQLPRLATMSFRQWVRRKRPSIFGEDKSLQSAPLNTQQVVLWVDTFNNYFHPETCRAALEVLEDAGFNVICSLRPLCCGRPLYDFGMLERAKNKLRQIMNALGTQIDAGLPIVVLEPSCASVFRDELHNLFPTNDQADRLRSQTFLLSEFLQKYAPDYPSSKCSIRILLHGHCHQKALMKMDHEEALLRRLGAEVQSLDSGCCGMAGPFGFQKDKFEVSQAVAERVLLPAVRNAAHDTLIVTDGFSCREQILQGTGKPVMHLAEVLKMTLNRKDSSEARQVGSICRKPRDLSHSV
ncbi:MAG: FAD-binding oxidoreductase, partial [Acidobacteria bacterium]